MITKIKNFIEWTMAIALLACIPLSIYIILVYVITL